MSRPIYSFSNCFPQGSIYIIRLYPLLRIFNKTQNTVLFIELSAELTHPLERIFNI